MKEIAEVIKDNGRFVLLKIKRHSACSKCEKKCGLANNHEHEVEELIFEVDKNEFEISEGQRVILEMQEKYLMLSALIIYLFPLLFMIMGYFITNWLLMIFTFEVTEGTGILGSFLFLIGSFIIIRKINDNVKKKNNFKPKITGILDS